MLLIVTWIHHRTTLLRMDYCKPLNARAGYKALSCELDWRNTVPLCGTRKLKRYDGLSTRI